MNYTLKNKYIISLCVIALLAVCFFLYTKSFFLKNRLLTILPYSSPRFISVNEHSKYQADLSDDNLRDALQYVSNVSGQTEVKAVDLPSSVTIVITETEQSLKFAWIENGESLVYASRSSQVDSKHLTTWIGLNHHLFDKYGWSDEKISRLVGYLVFSSVLEQYYNFNQEQIDDIYAKAYSESFLSQMVKIIKV